MNREDALAFVKKNGPLPGQPPNGACAKHPRHSCSCHLTLEQHAVAEELGNYTLYLFGMPYTGRVKVPHYPSGTIGFEPADEPRRERAQVERQTHVRQPKAKAPSAGKPAKKGEYDRLWRAAKAQGADALARFKADWAAKRAA